MREVVSLTARAVTRGTARRGARSETGQQLEDSSELKFVLKGRKSRANGRSIQGKVGWEQFREKR